MLYLSQLVNKLINSLRCPGYRTTRFSRIFLGNLVFLTGLLNCYNRPRWHRLGDPGITTNGTALANDGVSAKNCCSGINCYIVFYSRVAFFVLKRFFYAQGSKCYTLIYFYIVSNNSSFANYNTCCMVNKEGLADSSARMNIYASLSVNTITYSM